MVNDKLQHAVSNTVDAIVNCRCSVARACQKYWNGMEPNASSKRFIVVGIPSTLRGSALSFQQWLRQWTDISKPKLPKIFQKM